MTRRTRKTYDNDATVVEVVENDSLNETATTNENVSVLSRRFSNVDGTSVAVTDIFETMAGYVMPNFRFLKAEGKGICMICGKETSMSCRKLCGDCMKESGERAYRLSCEAIQNGEKEVTI